MSSVFDRLDTLPRLPLCKRATELHPLPNLARLRRSPPLYIKRDDQTGLAFGGNKVRQLEYYFGQARQQDADTILITGAVQSNFVRLAAAAARQCGMDIHIQLERRVPKDDPIYQRSGNVLLDKLFGATLYDYPDGEDEAGADQRIRDLAEDLRRQGRRPYVIPLAPGHPPYGALGYVAMARELLQQIRQQDLAIGEIHVASGSGHTHGGLLFGLRALGCQIPVRGVCVRRPLQAQQTRIRTRLQEITALLSAEIAIDDSDIRLDDRFLAPGYGQLNAEATAALGQFAHAEGILLDPVYTAKTAAAFLDAAANNTASAARLLVHTGGTPALFAYEKDLTASLSAVEVA